MLLVHVVVNNMQKYFTKKYFTLNFIAPFRRR